MSIAQRVKDYLDEQGVPFTYGTHRLVYTAEEVAQAQHVPGKDVAIDAQYVRDRLSPILNNEDLSRYIL